MSTQLPEKFKVGDRTYELVSFHKLGKALVSRTMQARGKKLKANTGKEDGEFIYNHRSELPPEYCGKIILVFPDWHDPHDNGQASANIVWTGHMWSLGWWHVHILVVYGGGRFVRRCS